MNSYKSYVMEINYRIEKGILILIIVSVIIIGILFMIKGNKNKKPSGIVLGTHMKQK